MKRKKNNLVAIWAMILAITFQTVITGFGGVMEVRAEESSNTNENLVKYPSYEEDVEFEPHSGDEAKIGNWFYYGNGVSKVNHDAHNGDWSAKLTKTHDALEQDIPDLQKGETYKLSVWAKNTNPEETNGYIILKNYGGNEKQLLIDSTEYQQYETEFVYTGEKNQNARIGAWIENANGGEVYIDNWELVSLGKDIENLSIENGAISIDYTEAYEGEITRDDFEVSYSSSINPSDVKELSIDSESISDKRLVMEFEPLAEIPVEQVITVNVVYLPNNEDLKTSYTLEFTLDPSGEDVVNGAMKSLEVENGEAAITLEDTPTVPPMKDDFTLEYKVNDGSFKTHDIKNFKYNQNQDKVEFEYTPIKAGAEKQTVTIKVTYNKDSLTSDYVLEALEIGEPVSYYISSSKGNDSNDGQSPKSPWKTIEKVNEVEFEPGDEILFKAGEEWTGALKPQGSGVKDAPITIGKYGEGEKPVIKPGEDWTISHMNIAKQVVHNPTVNNGITFFNQEYWEVSDLELFDPSYEENVTTSVYRRGINISAEDAGDLHHFKFDNLEIHGFRGPNSNEGKSAGGIIMTVSTHLTDESKRVPTAVHDISVTNSKLYNLGRSGMNFISPWTTREGEKWRKHGSFGYDGLGSWKPYENIIVSNNIIHDIDGDGAIIDGSKNVTVDHNIVYRTVLNSWFAVGLFNWNSDDTVFEFNEVYDTAPADSLLGDGDGQGIEIDALNQNTLVQYNYMHDNSGGTFMWCNTPQLLGFDGTYRYNVIQNDGTNHGVIDWRPGHYGSKAYNNTIYHEDTGDTEKFMHNGATGMSEAEFSNNVFVNKGKMGSLNFIESEIDWERNVFYGYDEVPENDTTVITENPMFVDENTGQKGWDTVDGYNLDPESPLIDAGVEIEDNGNRDYFGTTLSDGKTDIGAVEYIDNTDVSASQIQSLVEELDEAGEFEDKSAVRSLTIHLTAVNLYEEKEDAKKVVKHMNGFNQLLNHQKKSKLISEKAFKSLKKEADSLIKKWE